MAPVKQTEIARSIDHGHVGIFRLDLLAAAIDRPRINQIVEHYHAVAEKRRRGALDRTIQLFARSERYAFLLG